MSRRSSEKDIQEKGALFALFAAEKRKREKTPKVQKQNEQEEREIRKKRRIQSTPVGKREGECMTDHPKKLF
jgi:hypothetical protein